ncbi:glycosyltransferase family protein [Algoriphagus sp. A40]|uniref:glycosyltransferase family protein n=1 Tax=Algoriphagus sp. A40 TaxID=1945863 RepID=UPI000985B6AE|nr:glycosyltransferase family protein [Algoriphagus sp. A40]OOG76187.1 glycosyltransferase [Algoriphagus sp. A40]
MNFLFIVQGEGRGHLTQAIAFSQLLENHGHQLCGVIVGKSKRRELPEFFKRELQAPIHLVESPNFECDASDKKILIGKTISKNLLKTGVFWKSLKEIDQLVQGTQPDIILNFYDLLGGLYNFIFRPEADFWVIGHQYLIHHQDFLFAPNRPFDKFLFKLNTLLTALGAKEKLALSFLPKEPGQASIRVVPPLLRKEIRILPTKNGDFYLAYMVNPGYAEEVISYAKANPQLRIKAYWDKKDAAETENLLENLSFHKVNDKTFLQDMATCRGLVCTAGFESVCEAMYLGKPVMMIPVAGQYEQACNALDAEASGAGIASERFDFGYFDRELQALTPNGKAFHAWENTWNQFFESLLISCCENKQRKISPLVSKMKRSISNEPELVSIR